MYHSWTENIGCDEKMNKSQPQVGRHLRSRFCCSVVVWIRSRPALLLYLKYPSMYTSCLLAMIWRSQTHLSCRKVSWWRATWQRDCRLCLYGTTLLACDFLQNSIIFAHLKNLVGRDLSSWSSPRQHVLVLANFPDPPVRNIKSRERMKSAGARTQRKTCELDRKLLC